MGRNSSNRGHIGDISSLSSSSASSAAAPSGKASSSCSGCAGRPATLLVDSLLPAPAQHPSAGAPAQPSRVASQSRVGPVSTKRDRRCTKDDCAGVFRDLLDRQLEVQQRAYCSVGNNAEGRAAAEGARQREATLEQQATALDCVGPCSTRQGTDEPRSNGSCRIEETWSREAKWWDRQMAQKLCPQGCSATQARNVPRQIWHWKSSSEKACALVYRLVLVRSSVFTDEDRRLHHTHVPSQTAAAAGTGSAAERLPQTWGCWWCAQESGPTGSCPAPAHWLLG